MLAGLICGEVAIVAKLEQRAPTGRVDVAAVSRAARRATSSASANSSLTRVAAPSAPFSRDNSESSLNLLQARSIWASSASASDRAAMSACGLVTVSVPVVPKTGNATLASGVPGHVSPSLSATVHTEITCTRCVPSWPRRRLSRRLGTRRYQRSVKLVHVRHKCCESLEREHVRTAATDYSLGAARTCATRAAAPPASSAIAIRSAHDHQNHHGRRVPHAAKTFSASTLAAGLTTCRLGSRPAGACIVAPGHDG